MNFYSYYNIMYVIKIQNERMYRKPSIIIKYK